MNAPGRFLAWDSEFFGQRIGSFAKQNPRLPDFEAIDAWCVRENIACLYFLAEAGDFEATSLAERRGFHLTDIRLEMENTALPVRKEEAKAAPAGCYVREFRMEDLPELQRGARDNHQDSRFFRDSRFSRERAAELYAVWLEKTCRDPDAVVFTAVHKDAPVGYISCGLEKESSGKIILAGVREGHRGLGLGTLLVHSGLKWFRARGCAKCSVVTQGANIPAQRLYASHGFYPARVQLWYHQWFPSPTR